MDATRTLVFGAGGFLGRRFVDGIDGAIGTLVDIAAPEQVRRVLEQHRPDVVINCAGKTGRPNVDWCESHRIETLRSNAIGPLVLLEACLEQGLYFVHLSSGCVYQGDNDGRGFSETDQPNFCGSYYVKTKLYSESLLSDYPVLILRPRMVFDGSLDPRNLIMKLVGYQRLLDVKNSLTYVPELITVAKRLVEQRATGVFNVVNEGVMSPYEIMLKYKSAVIPSHVFQPLNDADLSQVTVAARSNCCLSTEKLAERGIALSSVHRAVDEALASISTQRGRKVVTR